MNNLRELILVRGLPGSGKTTLVKLIAGDGDSVFSIDEYFISEKGVYEFRYQENHLAYKSCEDRTRKAMQDNVPKIWIDHTFTMEWEMEPYFKLAAEFEYRLHVVTVEKYHDGKNVHDITDEQLQKMAAKYSVRLI